MSFEVRTHYQDPQVAGTYDQERFASLSGMVFQWAERRALLRVLRLLPAGCRVLDSPCGTGRILTLLLELGHRAVAGDISGEMLAVARRRTAAWNGRVAFSRLDCLRVGLADQSVTALFSIRFLPHIPPEERVLMLREFRRVSQRWVIVSLSPSTPWHRFRRQVKAWLGHPKPVRHPLTRRALADELWRADLREVKRMHTFPILSEQVLLVCERA